MFEFKFPTSVSIAAKDAQKALLNSIDDAGAHALMNGAVIVYSRTDDTAYWGEIKDNGAIHQSAKIKRHYVKNLRNDSRFVESSLNLKGTDAPFANAVLHRVVYAKTNLFAAKNAAKTAEHIGLSTRSVPAMNLAALTVPKSISVEHEIKPHVTSSFGDITLMSVFKYINEEDKTTLALKVGNSTAITGIKLDVKKNIVNVATYEFEGIKIRLKKNVMVALIE